MHVQAHNSMLLELSWQAIGTTVEPLFALDADRTERHFGWRVTAKFDFHGSTLMLKGEGATIPAAIREVEKLIVCAETELA